jgi:hypothetical protein
MFFIHCTVISNLQQSSDKILTVIHLHTHNYTKTVNPCTLGPHRFITKEHIQQMYTDHIFNNLQIFRFASTRVEK